jgi:hypothetical protein
MLGKIFLANTDQLWSCLSCALSRVQLLVDEVCDYLCGSVDVPALIDIIVDEAIEDGETKKPYIDASSLSSLVDSCLAFFLQMNIDSVSMRAVVENARVVDGLLKFASCLEDCAKELLTMGSVVENCGAT